MRKALEFCGLALALLVPVCEPQSVAPAPPETGPQPGVVAPHVVCSAHPEQSYALYLPSQYKPEKRWPIVYVFDPAARGNLPVELMKAAAERYGYIIAGSNNSRNGPWKPEIDAAQAMSDDTRVRFAIDDKRIYFAGFSGAAREAARIAQLCKCAGGVLLSGAGFSNGAAPTKDSVFAVFSAVGDVDFNFAELTQLDEKLELAGFPHTMRRFAGPHEWPPAAVMDETLAWFRLMAMKENREPRDDAFISAQKDAQAARVAALQQSGDLLAAWRENQQAARTFDGLADAGGFQQAAGSLAGQKAVRDAAKHEKQDFEEEERLAGDISPSLNDLKDPTAHGDTLADTEHKVVNLREQAEREKHPDKQRVYQRALAGLFAAFVEAGEDALQSNQIPTAKDYFELASEAKPDLSWPLNGLAAARALSGDRKGALEALRKSKEKSKDLAAFVSWLEQEPAFAKLREDPQFQALTK